MSASETPAHPISGSSDTADVRRLVERVREINHENERLFRELADSEGRFRKLARGVWRVQEEERRRLARELHDGIGQLLTALKHRLDLGLERLGDDGEEGAAQQALEDAAFLADQALADARELSRMLRPQVLDDLGLGPALNWLTRTLRERAGLEVELEIDGLDERLESELETLVFRVVQEALTNVLKHSGARTASVAVRAGTARISLVVEDPGCGFDPAGVGTSGNEGSGLRGIRDRVELFGGRLAVLSSSGEGTEIRAEIPLREEPER